MEKSNFRLLIVDDIEEIRELLCIRLRSDGYDCLTAANGQEAVDIAQSNRLDLILLDLLLPVLNGYEVCERLKEIPATRRVPIIFLTARSQVEDRIRSLKLGAVDYIPKPFDLSELVARVEAALRTKETMDSLERANTELHTSSVTDALSNLYNRRHFEHQLSLELASCERTGVQAACFLLDIDLFKRINDTYGHLAGDAVIRQFADVLRERTRKGDLAARFGGDEFAVLLPGVNAVAAEAAAEKIRWSIQETDFRVDGKSIDVSTSIGLTCFPLGEQTEVSLIIEEADRALYQAKLTRNRVVVAPTRIAAEQPARSS